MTDKPKKRIIVLIIALVFAATWLLRYSSESQLSAPSPETLTNTQTADTDAPYTGLPGRITRTRQSSMRPDSHASDHANFANLLELDDDALQIGSNDFEDTIEQLIAGNQDGSRRFSSKVKSCRELLADRSLHNIVISGGYGAFLSKLNEIYPDPKLAAQSLENFERELALLRQQMPECLAYYQHADNTLRLELERLAASGNVAARAAYAHWPPHRDVTPPGVDDVRYWEVRALEFSLDNLEAGEALGFEVFAAAYGSGQLFAPKKPLIGGGFTSAALRCGFDLLGVDTQKFGGLNGSLAYKSPSDWFINELLRQSDALRHYCKSGKWMDSESFTLYLRTLYES